MHTGFSRVKTYDNVYCIGEFKKSAINVNKDALLEYEHLKQNDLFSTIKRNAISGDTVTVLVLNVRSLPRHVDSNKQKVQYSANVNVLGDYIFSVFWNLENQSLHKILVPMVYNKPYILSYQIWGIFKGT